MYTDYNFGRVSDAIRLENSLTAQDCLRDRKITTAGRKKANENFARRALA